MRHWYLLADRSFHAHRRCRIAESAIVAHRGKSPFASLSPAERQKMLWLGLVESVPLFTGGIFAAYADRAATSAGLAAGAILLCIAICWCLRHQNPATRIELSLTGPRGHDDSEQPRERSNQSLQLTASRRTTRLSHD